MLVLLAFMTIHRRLSPQGDRLSVDILVRWRHAGISSKICPYWVRDEIGADGDGGIVADELALQDLPAHQPDAEELHLRILRLGGNALELGVLEVQPDGAGLGIVEIDAVGVESARVERDIHMPSLGGDAREDLVGAGADLEVIEPVRPIGRHRAEDIAVRLDRVAAGVELAVAIIRPGDIEQPGHTVDGERGEAVDAEVLVGQRAAANIGIEGEIKIDINL